MLPQHQKIILNQLEDPVFYNIRKGLKNWKNKLNNLGESEILDIACVGDSITEGYQNGANAATLMANGWKWKLSQHFNAKYDDVGNGWMHHIYPSITPLTTYAGTWYNSMYNFFNLSKYSAASGDTVSFPFAGTGCEIWCQKAASLGTIDVSIDGGEATTLNLATAPYGFPQRLTIASGLENTTHTATITHTIRTGGSNFHFSGYMEHKGTRGVRVHMTAKTGAGASGFTNATQCLPWFTLLNPDLVIYSLGTNDYMSNIAPASFKTSIITTINHLKTLGCDVLLTTDGCNDNTGYTYKWEEFTSKIREVAREYDCAFIDTDRLWGGITRARANGYMNPAPSTDIHFTILGHASNASVILKAIDV